MTGYELSRKFFDWTFENPEKVKPVHVSVYFFAVEQCNRLGWKEKFSLPASHVMEATGIKSYNTYKKALLELIEFGFIKMIQQSKNQHTANIVALSNFDKALDKALDKANATHLQRTDSIDKQETKKPINKNENKKSKEFIPPSIADLKLFCKSNDIKIDVEYFWKHYNANNWYLSNGNKMKNWHQAIYRWEKNSSTYQKNKTVVDSSYN